MLPHPGSNSQGFNVLQVFLRDDDTWTNIPTDVNSACGG